MIKKVGTILALVAFIACGKPDQEIHLSNITQTQIRDISFIGHKGSGDAPFGYKKYKGNSYESILNAMNKISGSEFDIQMSKDNTLWIFHDHVIKNCAGKKLNIGKVSDKQVAGISKCKYGNQLIKLADFAKKLEGESFEDKTISLDLKVLSNNFLITKHGSKKKLSEMVAEKVKVLEGISGLTVLVEVPKAIDVEIFEDITSYEAFILAGNEGAVSEAKQDFNYSYSLTELSKTKNKYESTGESKQIWTANSAEQMIEAIRFSPGYIQTDNVPLANFFQQYADKVPVFEQFDYVKKFDVSKEYNIIKKLQMSDFKKDFLINLKVNKKTNIDSPLMLVISGRNGKGKKAYWEGYKISPEKSDYYEYINLERLLESDCEELKIYVWNKDKVKAELNDLDLKRVYFK